MALTGRADGPPLVAPDDVVERILDLGRPLGVDVLALLGERASLTGLSRRGRVSSGGAARLVQAAPAWLAVNLPRVDDVEAVPAWLEVEPGSVAPGDPWPAVEQGVTGRDAAALVDRAALLSLPVSRLREVLPPAASGFDHLPVRAVPVASPADVPPTGGPPLVVDLSSLWAGPLCGRLLAETGATVVKVESKARPDGARRGSPRFFDRLNGGKRSVVLDLGAPGALDDLRRLLDSADVVIEASRPRALRQLGIHAEDALAEGGPRAWVSITGYGRDSDRVAFGDDAAVAGGLVADDGTGPCFFADAAADPLTGTVAAAAARAALDAGGHWLLDVAMAPVAAHVAGAGERVWRW